MEEVTLDVHEDEFLVLVGPSGCGKSTLLRMVAGLEEISGGRIFIGDRDVSDVVPKDRNVAIVFQSYALYPNKTVAQNLAFPLLMQGVPKDVSARMVREAAAILGPENLLDRKPRQLSGGQRQRVAMAPRSFAIRTSSCSTSRSPTSLRNCVYRCARTAGCAPRSFTSPTIRPRR